MAAQAFIKAGLLEPVADRISRRLDLARQLVHAATRTRQFDDPPPVFRGIRWTTFRHRKLLLPLSPTPSTKTGQLQSRHSARLQDPLRQCGRPDADARSRATPRPRTPRPASEK